MARSYIPPDIWIRVFRACVLELDDWEWRRETDQRFSERYNPRPKWSIWQGFHPGARSLPLVCHQWANLILSDERLKIIQVHTNERDGEFDGTAYVDEMHSALMAYPGYALHIYLWARYTSELINFLKSHSGRIHGLTIYSSVYPSRYFSQLDCMMSQLQYFHWKSLASLIDDEGSDHGNLQDDSLLMGFLSRHSRHLEVLVLNPGYESSISLADISLGITELDLNLSRQKPSIPVASLSIESIHTLMEACSNLKKMVLHTALPQQKSGELRLNFLSENSPSMTAHRLREFTVEADEIFILQVLSSISMPRLETLQVLDSCSDARIHPDSLRSASSIHFPKLKTITINTFSLLLADFLSIPIFSSLDKLSVSFFRPDEELLQDHNAFQHCSSISLLRVDGSHVFYDRMLYHFACHNIPVQSLVILSSVPFLPNSNSGKSHDVFELTPMPFLSVIHSLTVEGHIRDISSHRIPWRIFRKLPGVEILTFDMSIQSLNDLNGIISYFFKRDLSPGALLPGLKTLKLLLRQEVLYKPTDPILFTLENQQCKMLSETLHQRFDMGYGLQVLICNYPIAPRTLAFLTQFVGEVLICDINVRLA